MVLFKYRSKLIGKAIFTSLIEESKDFGLKHCLGYFSIEPDFIEIFNEEIDLEKLNKYFPHITNMLTDRLFDLDSSNKTYEMIDDYT